MPYFAMTCDATIATPRRYINSGVADTPNLSFSGRTAVPYGPRRAPAISAGI